MDYEVLLKHYQEDLKDEELMEEALATLELYFGAMDKEILTERSRPLAIAYLALNYERKKRKGYQEQK